MPSEYHAPERWRYKEQTRMKHAVLSNYLTQWGSILRRPWSGEPQPLYYVDSFAGRGRYEGGESGSPIIAMEIGQGLHDHFDGDIYFVCHNMERDEENFESLKREVAAALACFILERAARTQRKGCSACDRGWVFVREEIVDPGTGEVAEVHNPVRCRRCGGGLPHEEVQRWLEAQRWHYARSRPTNPHEYALRREAGDEATFEKVVEHIREMGSPYPWWGTFYQQYVAGQWCYWTMGSPPSETVLINRKSLEQVRIDQLTNKGGGGVVWRWLHNDIEAEREELRRQEAGQEELEGA